MKKRIICLLAALLLLLGLSVSASAAVYANVIDTAELLSESEAEALDARCSELEQTYGCGVYLVTVDDYTAYYSADSIESFAESVFLDLGLGAGEEQDGVLLVTDVHEQDAVLLVDIGHGQLGAVRQGQGATVGRLTAAFRVEHRTFQRDESAAGTAVRHGGQQDAFGPGAEGIRFKIFFSALHGA